MSHTSLCPVWQSNSTSYVPYPNYIVMNIKLWSCEEEICHVNYGMQDGNTDLDALRKAIQAAKDVTDKPSLLKVCASVSFPIYLPIYQTRFKRLSQEPSLRAFSITGYTICKTVKAWAFGGGTITSGQSCQMQSRQYRAEAPFSLLSE